MNELNCNCGIEKGYKCAYHATEPAPLSKGRFYTETEMDAIHEMWFMSGYKAGHKDALEG